MTVRWNAKPTLRRPALVAAFSGWNDAADAASDGVRWLARSVGARVFATLDTEEYLDFQAARPTVELVDGVIREIQWPALAFSAGSAPDGRPRPRAAARRRAEPALADILRRRDLGGARDRLRDGRDARRAARRRAALAPDALHRLGDRRGARRPSRHGALALRGPDRHRRRAARLRPPGRLRVRVDLGAGTALRRDRTEPEGDARAAHASGIPARHAASSSPTSRSRRPRGNGRSTRSSPATPTRARTSSGSSSATTNPPKTPTTSDDHRRRPTTTTTGSTKTTCRRASRSPKTSSATSANRATSSRASLSRAGRARGRPRGGSRARATRCRRVRRCRGTCSRSRRTRASG